MPPSLNRRMSNEPRTRSDEAKHGGKHRDDVRRQDPPERGSVGRGAQDNQPAKPAGADKDFATD